jgi:hypothetical protein
MISYQIYKIIHLTSILGFYLIMAMAATDLRKTKLRMILSGIFLLTSLVGGFGLMARLGIPQSQWPFWIWIKMTIWILVGSLGHILLKRAPRLMRFYIQVSFLLFILAAWAANYKPY